MCTLLVFVSILSYSQIETSTLTAPQAKKFAQSAIRVDNLDFAIQCLEKYMTLKPNDAKSAHLLGDLYRELRLYPDALKWYKYSYELNTTKNLKSLYYYALMQKMNGNYELAEEFFEKFKKEGRKSDFYKKIRKEYQAQINGIELAKLPDEKIIVNRLNETINQTYSESAPILINDTTILFSAFNNESSDSLQTVFYKATLSKDTWQKEKAFQEIENMKENFGNGCFSADKKRFYFTKCSENWQGKLLCEIYVTVQKGNKWETPVKLGNKINLPNYTSTQPTLGKNNKNADILYFVSDRSGGEGGKDIWYTEYDIRLNEFKEPVNAGRKINSKFDEITPFIDNKNNTLFFSSNGHPGLGGLDVFTSHGAKRKWSEPENMKAPINSSADELYYSYNEAYESGLLVSNREDTATGKIGTCCDDIFAFKYIKESKIELKGNVYFASANNYSSYFKSGNNLANMSISLYYIDNENEELFVSSDTTDNNGNFRFKVEPNKKYKILVDDYQADNFEIIAPSSDTTLTASIGLFGAPSNPIILEDIYYEFDDVNLTASAQKKIEETLLPLLKENSEVRIEILSHTDNLGSDEYNYNLSQKRAEAVVDFLVDNGIDYSRLIAIGYGESMPIAFNVNPDGSDNEEGRMLNRRTELKIISDDNFNFVSENINKSR